MIIRIAPPAYYSSGCSPQTKSQEKTSSFSYDKWRGASLTDTNSEVESVEGSKNFATLSPFEVSCLYTALVIEEPSLIRNQWTQKSVSFSDDPPKVYVAPEYDRSCSTPAELTEEVVSELMELRRCWAAQS